MHDWRPLLAHGGRQTRVKRETDGSFLFHTSQDCDPVLERNKLLRDQSDRGWIMDGDMRRVASIPMAVVLKWKQEGLDVFSGDQQDDLAKRLNDPDNFYLRTAPGRLGPVGDGTYR